MDLLQGVRSSYGYDGHPPDGTLCFVDGAGSGGGGINPEVVARLRADDTSADSPFSPQCVPRVLRPIVTQIRTVLERYAAAGGSVRTEVLDGSGHGPAPRRGPRWLAIFRDFLATIG